MASFDKWLSGVVSDAKRKGATAGPTGRPSVERVVPAPVAAAPATSANTLSTVIAQALGGVPSFLGGGAPASLDPAEVYRQSMASAGRAGIPETPPVLTPPEQALTPLPLPPPPVRDTAEEEAGLDDTLRSIALMSLVGGGYNPTALAAGIGGQRARANDAWEDALRNWQMQSGYTQGVNQQDRQAYTDRAAVREALNDSAIRQWEMNAQVQARTAEEAKAAATLQYTLAKQRQDEDLKTDDARRQWIETVMDADPASKEALVTLLEQSGIAGRFGLNLRGENGNVLEFNKFYATAKSPQEKAMGNLLSLFRTRQPLSVTLPLLNQQMTTLGLTPFTPEQVSKMSRLEEARLADILSRTKFRGLYYGIQQQNLSLRQRELLARQADREFDNELNAAEYGRDAAGVPAQEAKALRDRAVSLQETARGYEKEARDIENNPARAITQTDPNTGKKTVTYRPLARDEKAAIADLKRRANEARAAADAANREAGQKEKEARRATPPAPFPSGGPPSSSIPREISRHAPVVQRVAQETDLDPDILFTLIEMESGGDPASVNINNNEKVTNRKGPYWNTRDLGLMQLNSKEYGMDWNWQDPYTNVSKGAKHFLQKYQQAGGDLQEAFRRYNGSGRAAQNYARRAMQIYNRLKGGVRVRETSRRVSAIDRPARVPEGFAVHEETGIPYRVIA